MTKKTGPEKSHATVPLKLFIPVLNETFFAEVDTDSHISFVSKEFFKRYKKATNVEYLNEPRTSFNGLGSSLASDYRPFLMEVQIGKILIWSRFVVCNEF